ncbi:receptor-like protein kinase At3g21340 [Syzygium oleosum]|uniref:receptor-like protein kinase At3g21340 n=1 Tax=Syzygium oleosum TaxID=219896 RepID=UPI0024BB43DD|nr:receptor-like protein kinase At3g21340 [Syzygium oleosum]
MEYLDLSNNQRTGAIPETLSELQNLRYLNLSGNNLIGSVPEALKKRVLDNTLIMSLTGNTNLCGVDPCLRKKKQKNILVPVVASVSGFFVVLFGALAIVWLIKRKRIAGSSESMLRLKNRPFTYGEVSRITGNFRQVIGEGGFGKVYLGTLENGTEVAVKMLSKSSKQGYKEFQAEDQLLMIIHHGNLVSLFGYCDDSRHMALIYEYMANGNLRQHLSEDHLKVLTWSRRLQIAVDIMISGLDYLHNGCKPLGPPIIHRDLKTTNILLNEDFRAKIANFGLSRAFATENDSYVSTCPAGTPSYLDPE